MTDAQRIAELEGGFREIIRLHGQTPQSSLVMAIVERLMPGEKVEDYSLAGPNDWSPAEESPRASNDRGNDYTAACN